MIVLRDRWHQYTEDENGYLFAHGIHAAKIKAEDLPEWYVYGRYYSCFGYLSAKGVVDMKYAPIRYSNHFLTKRYQMKQKYGVCVFWISNKNAAHNQA